MSTISDKNKLLLTTSVFMGVFLVEKDTCSKCVCVIYTMFIIEGFYIYKKEWHKYKNHSFCKLVCLTCGFEVDSQSQCLCL